MCGGSDRVGIRKDPSPDPSTYSYNPMTPEEMDAQYRATGKVPYSYYGNYAPGSMDEYKAHRAYYGGSYVDKPAQGMSTEKPVSNTKGGFVDTLGTLVFDQIGRILGVPNMLDQGNQQEHAVYTPGSENPFSKLIEAMLKNKQG